MPRPSTAINFQLGGTGPSLTNPSRQVYALMNWPLINPETVLTGAGPWFSGVFTIPSGGAVKLRAFTLGPEDRVLVREVLMTPPTQPVVRDNGGCCVTPANSATIKASVGLLYCGKEVRMCSAQPQLYIKDQGNFLLEFSGPGFVNRSITLTAEAVQGSVVSDAMLSRQCDVCSTTTNYCPSIVLPGGMLMFSPTDLRDPAATVAVMDCSSPPVVVGYIFPASGPGHTLPVQGCNGVIAGYAADAAAYAGCS